MSSESSSSPHIQKRKVDYQALKTWLHVATDLIIKKRVYIKYSALQLLFCVCVHPPLDVPVKTLLWFLS